MPFISSRRRGLSIGEKGYEVMAQCMFIKNLIFVLSGYFYKHDLNNIRSSTPGTPISAGEYANTLWPFRSWETEGGTFFFLSVILLNPKSLSFQEFTALTYTSPVCTKDKVSAFPSNCLAFNQCRHKCDLRVLNPNILLVQINMICKKSQINNPLHTNGL